MRLFSPEPVMQSRRAMTKDPRRSKDTAAARLIRAWIEDMLAKHGISVEEWAKRSGVGRATIFRAKKADYEFATKANILADLAKAIDEPPPVATQSLVRVIQPRFLTVRYKVQAGMWRETNSAIDFIADGKPVVADPRYDYAGQWLELVDGDSCNLKFAPGSFVHVVDAIDLEYIPRNGDWVVVERTRDGGMSERTVKQLEVKGRNMMLWPRSSNPQWSDPITLSDGMGANDAFDVAIVGLVIGSYSPV